MIDLWEWTLIGATIIGSHVLARLLWMRPVVVYEEVIVR